MKPRYATADDLRRWYGCVPFTGRAVVLEQDGELVAIAGIAIGAGEAQAFSDVRGSPSPVALGRTVMLFRRLLDEHRGSVIAMCTDGLLTAPRLLAWLGFRPTEQGAWRHGTVRSHC